MYQRKIKTLFFLALQCMCAAQITDIFLFYCLVYYGLFFFSVNQSLLDYFLDSRRFLLFCPSASQFICCNITVLISVVYCVYVFVVLPFLFTFFALEFCFNFFPSNNIDHDGYETMGKSHKMRFEMKNMKTYYLLFIIIFSVKIQQQQKYVHALMKKLSVLL